MQSESVSSPDAVDIAQTDLKNDLLLNQQIYPNLKHMEQGFLTSLHIGRTGVWIQFTDPTLQLCTDSSETNISPSVEFRHSAMACRNAANFLSAVTYF